MDENLVGYLLDALDPETQREVEQHLETEPAAQSRLETAAPGRRRRWRPTRTPSIRRPA